MLKDHTQFPELKKSHFYELSISHFKKGLDPNCIVEEDLSLHPFFNEPISNWDKETHILTLALKKVIQEPEKNLDLFEFTKETILNLVKEKKIDDRYVKQMAFYSVYCYYGTYLPSIEFFINNNLIGINDVNVNSHTLLMMSDHPKKIKHLMDLGHDINIKLNNPQSEFHDMNVYEIAVKAKKSAVVKQLKPYLSNEIINGSIQHSIKELKGEKNVKKQIGLFRKALLEDNIQLVDEISNNQNFYKELIEYDDKQNINLINCAIRAGKVEALNKLINFDYYQRNKTRLTHAGACHTQIAIYSGKDNLAKILYDNGFKDESTLIKYLNNKAISSLSIVNKLIDDNHKLDIDILMINYSEYGSSKLQFTKDELKNFFKKHNYYLHFEKIKPLGKVPYLYYPGEFGNELMFEIKNKSINVLSNLLKQQEVLDEVGFKENLAILARGIGYHGEELGLKFSSLLLNNFFHRENEIIDHLSYHGVKKWISQLNKDNLEELLATNNDTEVKTVKKMKI